MLVPDPVVVVPPGLRVNVHEPEDGKLLRATLPVATEQVGWVIVPTTGAVGVTGWVLIITIVPGETHPAELLAVTVYVAAATPVNIPVVLVYVTPSIL
jgi:hypothetical protein